MDCYLRGTFIPQRQKHLTVAMLGGHKNTRWSPHFVFRVREDHRITLLFGQVANTHRTCYVAFDRQDEIGQYLHVAASHLVPFCYGMSAIVRMFTFMKRVKKRACMIPLLTRHYLLSRVNTLTCSPQTTEDRKTLTIWYRNDRWPTRYNRFSRCYDCW